MLKLNNRVALVALAAGVALLLPEVAHAATAGGGGLTFWENPLGMIQSSLTGRVPFLVGSVAFAIGFLGIVWSHDFGHLAKVACFLAMAVGGAMAAPSALAQLNITGATVTVISHEVRVG